MKYYIATLRDLPKFKGKFKKSELRRWVAVDNRIFYVNTKEILEDIRAKKEIISHDDIESLEVVVGGKVQIFKDIEKFLTLLKD